MNFWLSRGALVTVPGYFSIWDQLERERMEKSVKNVNVKGESIGFDLYSTSSPIRSRHGKMVTLLDTQCDARWNDLGQVTAD